MSATDGPEEPSEKGAIVAAGTTAITLPSGRRMEAELEAGGADLLRIRAHDGQCVLTVRITDQGPVLSFSGAALELDARRLDIACEDLRVRVSGGAALRIDGDLRMDAQSMALAAHPGGITLEANDDIALKGERVLLNSEDPPMPLSMAEYRARRRAAEAAPEALEAGDEPRADGD